MSGQIEISVLAHFALASQLGLGIVFLLSALPKLRRPLAFARSVVEYEILPAKVAYVFGLALIPLEAFLAIACLTGWLTDRVLLPFMMSIAAIYASLTAVRALTVSAYGVGHAHSRAGGIHAVSAIRVHRPAMAVARMLSAHMLHLRATDRPLGSLLASKVLAYFS